MVIERAEDITCKSSIREEESYRGKVCLLAWLLSAVQCQCTSGNVLPLLRGQQQPLQRSVFVFVIIVIRGASEHRHFRRCLPACLSDAHTHTHTDTNTSRHQRLTASVVHWKATLKVVAETQVSLQHSSAPKTTLSFQALPSASSYCCIIVVVVPPLLCNLA